MSEQECVKKAKHDHYLDAPESKVKIGTPVSQRINHQKNEADDENSFEGPEKLLEIWFTPLQTDDTQLKKGLRAVDRKRWEEMLALVHCTILSVCSNEFCDAYLLSESSFFVYSHQVVLKTCGTTTLLRCIEKMLEIAYEDCGLASLEDVFYSRKNFYFPDRQLEPHQSFEDEVKYLDRFFDGSAYIIGKINYDHWYLYTTDKDVSLSNPVLRRPVNLKPGFSLKREEGVKAELDMTLEIIMTNLDENKMRQFYKTDSFVSSKHVTETSGIADLIPGAVIDEFQFNPMGYSCNALLGSGYFTIHITPQPHCSYVSFETNIVMDSYSELLDKVMDVFCPGSFTVTLFVGGHGDPNAFVKKVEKLLKPSINECRRSTRTVYEFENNYKLAFGHYCREGKVATDLVSFKL